MTVKEYLKTEYPLNFELLASRMWPNNKDARTYLSRKLNGPLLWTEKDAVKAKSCLKEIFKEKGDQIDSLT